MLCIYKVIDISLSDCRYKAWLKGEISYANSKGLAISAYTLMQSAGGVPNITEDTLG